MNIISMAEYDINEAGWSGFVRVGNREVLRTQKFYSSAHDASYAAEEAFVFVLRNLFSSQSTGE
jgi:hypothetical protein